jgi:hypothetical protein
LPDDGDAMTSDIDADAQWSHLQTSPPQQHQTSAETCA